MLPLLHDWEIVGVSIDGTNNTVNIFMNMPVTQEQGRLYLSGVSHLFISKMMMQNVILDVLLFDSAIDSDYFSHCCSLLNIDSSFFQGNTENKIIYFEPSVGAEIACCFKELSFNRSKTDNGNGFNVGA